VERLPPDHPLARLVTSAFGDPEEFVYEGIQAIDWHQRMTPGTPLAYAERVLVATSKRLLLFYSDEDSHDEGTGIPASEVPYARMRNASATTQGDTGWLRFDYLTEAREWVQLSYAITDVAEVEQLASMLAQAPDEYADE